MAAESACSAQFAEMCGGAACRFSRRERRVTTVAARMCRGASVLQPAAAALQLRHVRYVHTHTRLLKRARADITRGKFAVYEVFNNGQKP